MKKVIAFLFLACPAIASYNYTTPLIIMHGQVSGSITNFPVLLSTNSVLISTASAGGHLLNSNGYDLVFSTWSDCHYLLHWDSETVNNTGSAQANYWINVPAVSSTTDTVFYMCYGNSGITTYQGISTATWDSNFTSVYHVTNGTVLNETDSTVNRYNGTDIGSGNSAATGRIDGGLSLSGSGYVDTGNAQYSTSGSFTFSALVNVSAWNQAAVILGQGMDGFGSGWNTYLGLTTGCSEPEFSLVFGADITGTSSGGTGSCNPFSNNTWHMITGTYNSSAGLTTLYQDGIAVNSTSLVNAGRTSTKGILIGNGKSGSLFLTGTVDELEVSQIDRSAGWILTEYNNQISPFSFIIFDTEINNTIPSENEKGIVFDGGKSFLNGGKLVVK